MDREFWVWAVGSVVIAMVIAWPLLTYDSTRTKQPVAIHARF